MPHTALLPALEHLEDTQLIDRYRAGDAYALDALLDRYRRLARAKARTYFLQGGDNEDVVQEGMIGLYKAARDFRPDRQSSFRSFAELCITRQVLSAVKAASRQKHRALNGYTSLSSGLSDEHDGDRADAVLEGNHGGDPADELVAREGAEGLRQAVHDVLSRLEVDVLRLYVEGRSYSEIGSELGRHTKSIDNALQRIKRKIDGHLQAQETETAA